MSLIVQQYLHCAAELESIAKLINAMNEFETALQKSLISIECGPEIWFTDKLMGHIVRTDEDNNEGEWAYSPARGEDGST